MGQVAAICESAYIGLTTAGELTDKPPGHNKRQDRRRSDTAHVINILAVGRIAQLVERTHLVDSSIILGEVVGSIPTAATSTGEEGMPQGGAKQLRRLRCIVSLIYVLLLLFES